MYLLLLLAWEMILSTVKFCSLQAFRLQSFAVGMVKISIFDVKK